MGLFRVGSQRSAQNMVKDGGEVYVSSFKFMIIRSIS